jgi:ParB-like chromosome segregation protein Spo0J
MVKKPRAAAKRPPAKRGDNLVLVYRHPEDLIPDAKNPRLHSVEEINQMMVSIRQFGFTIPILIDERNRIIAGHRRQIAASRLNLSRVPCIEARHLTARQRRAYIIADNQLALAGDWDRGLLAVSLADLGAELLAATGFSADDIADLSTLEGAGELAAKTREADASAKLLNGLSYQVLVQCKDEADQATVLEELKAKGMQCRPLIL